MALTLVLARMELCGFSIDAEVLRSQRSLMLRKMSALQAAGARLVCRDFCWDSPREIGEILFEQVPQDGR